MSISLDAANALESAIDGKIKKAATPRRRASGTVSRVDKDGTVYAVLESGIETVVEGLTASVNPGDTVSVTVENGHAEVLGNYTDPSAGVKYVRAVEGIAQDAGETAHAAVDSAAAAQKTADEAQKVAEATNQHFFADTNGAHITDVSQDEWKAAVADNFSDYDPTTKPYHNQLLNSLGILLRTALNNLVSITRSAIAFYDGQGNQASNIVARFGSAGAQIGKSGAAHSVIDADGQRFYGGTNGATQLANIGYGEGASATGTANAPYYTFGTRKANTAIGNYSVAEGRNVEASGFNSHAEGDQTTASGSYSHAEGDYTTASGVSSHAEGTWTKASGDASHAEGSYTIASGFGSHAAGRRTRASSDCQTVIGRDNIEDTNGVYALIIGNGTADDARSNALAVKWDGTVEAANAHQIMTASVSAALNLATTYQKVTLSQTAKAGDALSISSGGIKCAKDGTVMVAAQAYFSSMNDQQVCNVRVIQNSTSVGQSTMRASGDRAQVCFTPKLIEVAAGDVIYLHVANTSAANGSIPENSLTYMTVEYV